jgi:alpha-1,6-mannosyltransferase
LPLAGAFEHHLVVRGRPLVGTGPVEDMLRHRARQLGIADRVQFVPYLTDRDALARRFAATRCVVLPGPDETFGLAALEAAACGAPVVTAAATPSAALIDGPCETFRAGDADDLRRAIGAARRRPADQLAAARLATRHGWNAALAAELADLRSLLGR